MLLVNFVPESQRCSIRGVIAYQNRIGTLFFVALNLHYGRIIKLNNKTFYHSCARCKQTRGRRNRKMAKGGEGGRRIE